MALKAKMMEKTTNKFLGFKKNVTDFSSDKSANKVKYQNPNRNYSKFKPTNNQSQKNHTTTTPQKAP